MKTECSVLVGLAFCCFFLFGPSEKVENFNKVLDYGKANNVGCREDGGSYRHYFKNGVELYSQIYRCGMFKRFKITTSDVFELR